MGLDRSLMKHIAKVARLELTEEEIELFMPQLQEVLDAFSKLDEVDTKNVKPSFHPISVRNVLREDIEKPSITQEQALKNAEKVKDGYFMGPKAV